MPVISGRPVTRLRGKDLLSNAAISSATPAVECLGVAHRFGSKWALRGVTMTVGAGEIIALVGKNGSGKSTLVRAIATALRPSKGTIRVYGNDARSDPGAVRETCALVGHATGVYEDLTVIENLRFACKMAGEPHDDARLLAVLERVNLAHEANARGRELSAGQQRRIALSRVLLRPVRLLLLDEPYTSFDDDGVANVNDMLVDLRARGGSAIVITHEMERVRGIIDRTVRLDAGLVFEPSLTPTGAMPAFKAVRHG
jgi:heme exporter protein A